MQYTYIIYSNIGEKEIQHELNLAWLVYNWARVSWVCQLDSSLGLARASDTLFKLELESFASLPDTLPNCFDPNA